MAHDFAKQRSPQNGGKRKDTKQAVSKGSINTVSGHWSWFFYGLFAGLLFSFIIYLGVVKPAALQRLQAPIANSEPLTERIQESSSEVELGFYDYLVENEVTVEVVPVAILSEKQTQTESQTKNTDTSPANYLLLAGSFQVRLNATNLQAKINLLNLNAVIVQASVNGRTLHRVQAGPFKGRRQAEDAKKILSSNNIDTKMLLKR